MIREETLLQAFARKFQIRWNRKLENGLATLRRRHSRDESFDTGR